MRSGAHDASTSKAHPLRLVSAPGPDPVTEMLFLCSKKKQWPGSLPVPDFTQDLYPVGVDDIQWWRTMPGSTVPLQTARLPLQPPQTQPGRRQSGYQHCCPKGPPVPRGSPSSLSQVEKVSLERPLESWGCKFGLGRGRKQGKTHMYLLYTYYVPNVTLIFYPPFSSKPLTTIPWKGHTYSCRSHTQIYKREGCGPGPQPAPVDCWELGSGSAW